VAAVDAATARPYAVGQLTLVSPIFLQAHPPRTVNAKGLREVDGLGQLSGPTVRVRSAATWG